MASFVVDEVIAVESWDELRPRLDSALGGLPPGFIQERWEGETLYLEGSGLQATLSLVQGRFRAVAELRPPASFLSSMIEQKLREALAGLG